MFTGLVEKCGQVEDVVETAGGVELRVRADGLTGELGEGDSVAVSGICLTATSVAAESFIADVMHETVQRTTLGGLDAGSPVNLELALRAGDRLGGHMVQGHVDGVGEVAKIEVDGFARRLRIAADPGLLRYVVQKGSIAVDGVSLTVAAVDDDGFEVSLVPETLQRTTLGEIEQGALVNLEADVLAKYVEKLCPR